MKQIVIWCLGMVLIMGTSVLALAQDSMGDASDKETMVKEEKNKMNKDAGVEPVKINESRDRLIFELAYGDWMNKPDTSIQTKWHNRNFNVFFMYDLPIGNSKNVSIAPGIGLATNNIYWNGRFDVDSTRMVMTAIPDNVSYDRNKFSSTMLEGALELRFRTNPDRLNHSWKLAMGLRVGTLLSAHTKYRGDDIFFAEPRTSEVKIKDNQLPFINKSNISTTLRVGYGNFNVFGQYGLSTVFSPNRGPGVTPFAVGFSFNSL